MGVTAVLVLVVVGGSGFLGRRAGVVRAARAASAPPARARGTTTTAAPPEVVGVTDLPARAPVAVPEPASTPAGPRATHPVARTTVDFVDDARPPVPRGDAADATGRLLRTVIRFPDARADGPYPLVVFAHGYATETAAYAPLLDDLAASGYVVAAPEFPGTSTALADAVGGREPDEQVADVELVISEVRALGAGNGPLGGVIADGPVAVIGHSDGGITAAAAAFAARVRDERIGAAVVLSGARDDVEGPWFPVGSPALLAVHGDADTVNPFSASEALYSDDRSGSRRALVRVRGGGHTDAFVSARTTPALVVLVDDFLRAALGGDAGAAARLVEDASVPGVLEPVGVEVSV